MPKYKVETDQGTFMVELDREPESDEQLQSLVSDQLGSLPPKPIGAQVREKVGADAPLDTRLDAARQLMEQRSPTPEEPEDLPRERLTIGGELAGGLGSVGRGLYKMVTDPLQPARAVGKLASEPSLENLMGLADTGLLEAGLGVARTIGAPLSPLANVSTAAGVATQKGLQKLGLEDTADAAGALVSTALDFAAPGAVGKLARAKKAEFAKRFESNRQKANKLVAELEEVKSTGAAKIARQQELIDDIPLEAAESASHAVSKSLTADDVVKKLAPDAPLGEVVGRKYKDIFSRKFTESRQKFAELYAPIKEAGQELMSAAENYLQAGGVIGKQKGVTQAFRTKPEGVAARIRRELKGELDDVEDDTLKALQKQLDEVPVEDQARVQGVIDEFKAAADIPEQPSVTDLINERQRLRRGKQMLRTDAERNQLNTLVDGLNEDIARADPNLYRQLETVDRAYAKLHAPYFAPRSIPRAIAEGDANTVIDSIIRPTISSTGLAKKNHAVKAAEQVKKLVGDDPEFLDQLGNAFIKKGLQASMEGGSVSGAKLGKWWGSYMDEAGTGNKVLNQFFSPAKQRDVSSTIRQLVTTPAKTLEEVTADLTKNLKTVYGLNMKQLKAAQAATEKQLTDQITAAMGGKTSYAGGKFIGQLFITEGVIDLASGQPRQAGAKIMRGGLLILARELVEDMVNFARGRSLLKAAARAAPGSTAAAATARQIENFASRIRNRRGEEE